MLLQILKAKLHMAAVTETELNYHGSVTIDRDLMDAAGLLPYEKVLIANCENGSRAESYILEGPRGSRVIKMNGALAHLANVKDRVIIFSFVSLTPEEVETFEPQVVILDEQNEIIEQFRTRVVDDMDR